jgi:lysozyme
MRRSKLLLIARVRKIVSSICCCVANSKVAKALRTHSVVRKAVMLIVVFTELAFATSLNGQRERFPTVDQMTPGIFLDQDLKLPAAKSIALRVLPPQGLTLTKKSEGFRGHLYDDAAHYCTIAYGHLVKKASCDGTEPDNFLRGLSEPAGAALLSNDMMAARRAVSSLVNVDLTDGQYGALCDFVYNVGAMNFSKSTLLQAINDEDEDRIPPQFRRWILANGKELAALKVRRDKEVTLFFEGQPIPKALPPAGENLSLIDIRKGE